MSQWKCSNNLITILYGEDHEVRHVRMNQPHPAEMIPTWYGDSVGHYEGDTLVIDTVAIKNERPFAMIDMFGTPYTKALHVVERYRLLDYEAAKEGLERDAKENFNLQRSPLGSVTVHVDPNYRGKHLQLLFAVEDHGVFTMPWSATITYRRGYDWRGSGEWPEIVCARIATSGRRQPLIAFPFQTPRQLVYFFRRDMPNVFAVNRQRGCRQSGEHFANDCGTC
jgi:hypothetical protein